MTASQWVAMHTGHARAVQSMSADAVLLGQAGMRAAPKTRADHGQ